MKIVRNGRPKNGKAIRPKQTWMKRASRNDFADHKGEKGAVPIKL
jgi:hypothetical protein